MTTPLRMVSEHYERTLLAYLKGASEASLEEAYEIGKEAVETGLGVLDMAAIHQQALGLALVGARTVQEGRGLLEKATVFFTESLATFEMAHRGYQEANAALHELNLTLETRVEVRTAELRSTQERYRALVDGLDAIVWEADLERRRFTFVSNRAEKMLGYPVSDMVESDGFWESHVHPHDFEGEIERRAHAGALESDHVVEYRLKSADGRWVWMRDVVRVLRDGEGRPVQLAGVMIDVSEIVAIQQYRENLIDVISHEFRTPVTIIQGYAQLLTEAPGRMKPEAIKAAKERIKTASEHLSYLLNSITELSRLRSGGPPPRKEVLGSAEVIREAVSALTARGRGVESLVNINVSRGAERIEADRRKLVISLVELLDNAAKFSPPGAPIWVDAHLEGENLVISVEDQGPGIPDSLRDGLFKPFVQADMTAVRTTGGAGLGLAVVSGLVQVQGGRVEVDSVVGEGSAFNIVMPRAAATRARNRENQNANSQTGAPSAPK
jgi:PAS domain S-box-containing protein